MTKCKIFLRFSWNICAQNNFLTFSKIFSRVLISGVDLGSFGVHRDPGSAAPLRECLWNLSLGGDAERVLDAELGRDAVQHAPELALRGAALAAAALLLAPLLPLTLLLLPPSPALPRRRLRRAIG